MEQEKSTANRIVEVKKGVVKPRQPVLKNVNVKNLGDFPAVPQAYLDVAKLYSSPRLIGPPICDELMDIVQHLFTEEEASLVRHIKPFARKTAEQIAKMAHRPVSEVKPILEVLGREKFVILSMGDPQNRKYSVMPIIPGTFEAVMITTSMDKLNDYQKKFAVLFEKLHDTAFMTDYLKYQQHGVRYFPAKHTIEAHPMVLPTDKLEEVFDRYDVFGVGICQCRATTEIAGTGCGKTLENCVTLGEPIKALADAGKVRLIDKKEAFEIKMQAEAEGMVNWMINEESGKFASSSCSCCGCCCHMMRTVNEFNMPAMIAPPHFLPDFDLSNCDYCGKCAKACPMGAITTDMKGELHSHQLERCIGCGQCVIACDKKKAVKMEPMPNYKTPPSSYPALFMKMTPAMLRTAWEVWRSRK